MAGSQDKFGSKDSTGKKLDIVSEYLSMYQKTVKSFGNGYFNTIYVDAFAGTGKIPIVNTPSASSQVSLLQEIDENKNSSVEAFISGSTQRALSITPPFDEYIFIEKNRKKIAELENRFSNNALAKQISYKCGDANEEVIKFCYSLNKNDRAVLFLDP